MPWPRRRACVQRHRPRALPPCRRGDV